MRRFRRTPTVLVLLAAFAAGLVSGCSADASTRSAEADTGPTTTAAQVTVPETIPAGTELRLGDQLDYLKTILAVAGQDQDFDYEVEYANFVGGPPMLQAFKGGSLDAGFVASTPLIFAQAAGQRITAVAAWAPEHGTAALIARDPAIKGWKDLKGKRVAYQRGTSLEAGVLVGLDSVGLSADDITTVDVPFTQISATLQSGAADAAISAEPLISSLAATDPSVRVVAPASAVTDRANFVIASESTLADPAKSAALADYTARLVRAFVYLQGHPEKIAQAIFVDHYKLTPERATEVTEANGPVSFLQLPEDVVDAQQALADLFVAAGQIPAKVDVAAEFDGRFADLIAAAQEQTGQGG